MKQITRFQACSLLKPRDSADSRSISSKSVRIKAVSDSRHDSMQNNGCARESRNSTPHSLITTTPVASDLGIPESPHYARPILGAVKTPEQRSPSPQAASKRTPTRRDLAVVSHVSSSVCGGYLLFQDCLKVCDLEKSVCKQGRWGLRSYCDWRKEGRWIS